ncbi:nuclear transport factor 2 family protein [Flavobacterium sp. CS20]|uniref:nuclear transport factor 2 family protein n=1 Tax=Flavobacterium sp. CS20 TaxID=2775246 RepID=UPI001B3A1225|nr:nuclear transport factor 2 family protein [Flavobacterium sp. CS20]QTY27443.1 nuclear transport factor 2 family protein [Flavobacterium sp. CS20]
MSYKEIVTHFLYSDYYKDKNVFKDYIHPKLELNWNSSDGFLKLDFDGFFEMVQNMGKTFTVLTPEFSHIFAENNKVCVRFTYHVETLEHEENLPLAHFMSIWEIEDDKIRKGFIMSQVADDSVDNIFSYIEN